MVLALLSHTPHPTTSHYTTPHFTEGLTVNLLPATFRVTFSPEGDVDSLEVGVASPLTLARVAALRLRVRVLKAPRMPWTVRGARTVVSWCHGTTQGGSCRQSGHCFPGHTESAYDNRQCNAVQQTPHK